MKASDIYNNTFGYFGILTNSRENQILQDIIDHRGTGINSFFNSKIEKNIFFEKFELTDLYNAYEAETLIDPSVKLKDKIYEKCQFQLEAKLSNLSPNEWKADLAEFQNITQLKDGKLENLIKKYKEFPYITKKQIEIIKTNFVVGDLWNNSIVNSLLNTKYAIENNITSNLMPADIKKVTDLHLLVAEENIINAGLEVGWQKDSYDRFMDAIKKVDDAFRVTDDSYNNWWDAIPYKKEDDYYNSIIEKEKEKINLKINKAEENYKVQESVYQELKEAYDYQEKGIITNQKEFSTESSQPFIGIEKDIKSIKDNFIKYSDPISEIKMNQELFSSGSKTLIGDITISRTGSGTKVEISNYRIKDIATGLTEALHIKGIDLCNQPTDSIKKLLSGGKVALKDMKGTTNLFNLAKGPNRWTLVIGKQIFASTDQAAEI